MSEPADLAQKQTESTQVQLIYVSAAGLVLVLIGLAMLIALDLMSASDAKDTLLLIAPVTSGHIATILTHWGVLPKVTSLTPVSPQMAQLRDRFVVGIIGVSQGCCRLI